MSPRARIVLAALAGILAAALVLVVVLERPASHSPTAASPAGSTGAPSASGFDGAALPARARAHELTLTDLLAPAGPAGGRLVSLSSYRGQVVVVAFLYSTCGSTCIVIAQQIRGALDELSRPVPVLIVSADPSADAPARVRRFLAQVSLTGRVHYLTGSPAQLRAVWRAYGVTPASAGRAAFDNFASVFLIDPSGYERVIFGVEQLTPEGLAHDIRKLQAGRPSSADTLAPR
jgi:protein SCO1/2